MEIKFVKTGKKHNWVTATNDGRQLASFPWPDHPGLPHDLVHAVVEKTYGIKLGFWGLVQDGVDFTKINSALEAARTGTKVRDLTGRDLGELYLAEALAAVFQADVFSQSTDRQAQFAFYCAEWGISAPNIDFARAERELSELSQKWNSLPTEHDLTFTF